MWTAPRPVDAALDGRQRAWELEHALNAARLLQARLEMLGGHSDDLAWVRALRDRLAAELGGPGGVR